jgi:cytochrome P450
MSSVRDDLREADDLRAIDDSLVTEDFIRDPYATLDLLREKDPVHWSDSIGGWVLTRYDDILVTFKDVGTYSSEGRLARAAAHLPDESRAKLTTFESHFRGKGLIHSDPPDHTRLRRLVLKVFTPSVVEARRPRIQEIVDELIDRVEPVGRMEVIEDLAFAVPVTVLAGLLGVPASDGLLFRKWADGLLSFQGINKPSEATLLGAQQSLIEARAYMADLVARRHREPGDDLISHMVTAGKDGDRDVLSDKEIINTGITFLVAGHETTTSLIGNGLLTLLQHPDQWRELQQDRSLVTPAIEEILRFESPVARQPRLMAQDTTLGGGTIRAGQMVFQMLNAANRDPAHFADPNTFDIRRSPNRHIAFGYGIHFCIGAPLSRIEGQVVFQTILDRLPRLQLAGTPVWDLKKPNSRVLRSLPVTF